MWPRRAARATVGQLTWRRSRSGRPPSPPERPTLECDQYMLSLSLSCQSRAGRLLVPSFLFAAAAVDYREDGGIEAGRRQRESARLRKKNRPRRPLANRMSMLATSRTSQKVIKPFSGPRSAIVCNSATAVHVMLSAIERQ